MKAVGTFLSFQIGKAYKKSHSRSGSLLVLVLVIMAVAFILITSAMMISVKAREHYYSTAEMDQSHLTAMSAAKMIGDAVEKGTIDKTDLENLANSGAIYYLSGNNAIAPGLAGTKTTSPQSYTEALFGYSNAAKEYITVRVTTHIDNAATTDISPDESVTIYLKLTPVVIPDGFAATLAINGSEKLPNVAVGTNKPSDFGSNFVLLNGAAIDPNNGSGIYGGDLIIRNKVTLQNNIEVKGNLVLYGGNASINGGYGYILPKLSATSCFLDLCESAFPGSTFFTSLIQQPPVFAPAKMILKNASMNFVSSNSPMSYIKPSNKTIYTIGSGQVLLDGTKVVTSANFTVKESDGSMDSLIAKYTAAGAVQKSLDFKAPTTRTEFYHLLGLDAFASLTDTSSIITKLQSEFNAEEIKLSNLQSSYKKSAYYINISTSPTMKDPITFDLTDNSITLYVVGTGKLWFNSNDGGLRFIRPNGSGNIGRIVFMQDGASFDISPSAGTLKNFPGITGAGQDYNRYSNGNKDGVAITDNSEPYVYIYGFNNVIKYNSNKYMEGYYGLFGQTGEIYIEGQNKNKDPLVYGRFNVTQFHYYNGNLMDIPYCPAPGEGSNNTVNQDKYMISGYVTS